MVLVPFLTSSDFSCRYNSRSKALRKIDSWLPRLLRLKLPRQQQRRRRERQKKSSSPSWRTGDDKSQDVHLWNCEWILQQVITYNYCTHTNIRIYIYIHVYIYVYILQGPQLLRWGGVGWQRWNLHQLKEMEVPLGPRGNWDGRRKAGHGWAGKTMLSTSHDWEWFIAPIKMVMTGGWFIMVSTILAKIEIKIDDRFNRFIMAPGGNHLLFLSVHHC